VLLPLPDAPVINTTSPGSIINEKSLIIGEKACSESTPKTSFTMLVLSVEPFLNLYFNDTPSNINAFSNFGFSRKNVTEEGIL